MFFNLRTIYPMLNFILVISITAVVIIGMMFPNATAELKIEFGISNGELIFDDTTFWSNGIEFNLPGYSLPISKSSVSDTVDHSQNIFDPDASGEIILSENEFKLYGGSIVIFPIIVEMDNFIHKPTLEILYNHDKLQVIDIFSNGDVYQSAFALDDNWKSGVYEINLVQQNNILDTSSFLITRDNEIIESAKNFKSIFNTTEPFLSITPSDMYLDNSGFGTFSILGSISDSRTGHHIIFKNNRS